MPTIRLAALLLTMAAVPAVCQDNYEIQVYPGLTIPRGITMVELHSNYTSKGSAGAFGSHHALHETIEITHGFNEFFELGFYHFMSVQSTGGLQYVGNHIRPRFAVPERMNWPIGLSLSQEIGYTRSEFSDDTWTWELRPIIDKTIGRLYLAVNPVVGLVLKSNTTGSHKPEFAPQAQVGFDLTPKLNVALEFYGSTGATPGESLPQYLFPALNIDFGPDWEFNIATGIPLNSVTDRVAFKMIFGRRFGANK